MTARASQRVTNGAARPVPVAAALAAFAIAGAQTHEVVAGFALAVVAGFATSGSV